MICGMIYCYLPLCTSYILLILNPVDYIRTLGSMIP